MEKILTTSQRVGFDESIVGGGQITPITLEVGVEPIVFANDDLNAVAVRQFPNLTGVQLEASVGTIEDLSVSGVLVRSEFLEFANTQFSNARYPIDNGAITVDLRFAFTIGGDVLTEADLSFRAEKQENKIIANIPFIGAIKVDYVSTYRILRYLPDFGTSFTAAGQIIYSNYGHVLAFLDEDRFAVLEIEPPGLDFGESAQDKRRELYRVTSAVQVNQDGAWEKHPTFDAGGSWGASAPATGDAFFEYERVHEIGYISNFFKGNVAFETESFVEEQGPSLGFVAKYVGTFKPPADFADGFQDSYNKVKDRLPTVEADISTRWQGVSF